MVCAEKLRRWSSSSIIFRRWVTGTPPVTHTYIQAIKQSTLDYLTRSVCRRAATFKRRTQTSGPVESNCPVWRLTVQLVPIETEETMQSYLQRNFARALPC